MKVTALGTGDAFFSAGRGSTAWLVDDAAGTYALDFGPTAMLALRKLGRDPQALDAVYFTHLHGDHIAGWPFLLLDALLRAKRTKPLLVAGPPGTEARLQALWAACYADTSKRPLPFELRVHELQVAQVVQLGPRRIATYRAQHMTPPHVALSLRIDELAFTGDTGALPQGLCDGARWLCCECTDLERGSAKHLSWREVEQLETLPVEKILVAHLGEEARREARSSGKLCICDDLETYEL
jgi:glyoxylase-like metal-dependent hydrolase (beta-lactamase superfamily II)